jgi:hypothetical protein
MATYSISQTDKIKAAKSRRYVELSELAAFVWFSVTVNNMVVGLLSVLFISQMYPASREYLGNIIAALLLASIISFILFMLVFNKTGKGK